MKFDSIRSDSIRFDSIRFRKWIGLVWIRFDSIRFDSISELDWIGLDSIRFDSIRLSIGHYWNEKWLNIIHGSYDRYHEYHENKRSMRIIQSIALTVQKESRAINRHAYMAIHGSDR